MLLVSVPYALKAAEAETLSGKTAADFVLTEQLSTQVEEEINTQIEEQGLVTTEESGNMALVDGSGTAGKLAKFTTATDIGNSIITEKNGNIGIGFNNPTQKLVVAAGFGGGLALNFTNLVNQDLQVSVSAIDATDKFAFFGPSVPTNLVLGVGGAEKMRLTNAGNVGIGTSTPTAARFVVQVPSPATNILSGHDGTSEVFSVDGNGNIETDGRVDVGTNLVLGSGGSAAQAAIHFSGDENTGLFSPAADTVAFTTNGAELLRMTSGGNVGIGDTTPSAKLDVSGAATAIQGTSSSVSGIGVRGTTPNSSTTDVSIGVFGEPDADSSSSRTIGVYSVTDPTGQIGLLTSSDFSRPTAFVAKVLSGDDLFLGLTGSTPGSFSRNFRIASSGDLFTAGDLVTSTAGDGLVVKSPDGNTCARIGIDNAGAISVATIACPGTPASSTVPAGNVPVVPSRGGMRTN